MRYALSLVLVCSLIACGGGDNSVDAAVDAADDVSLDALADASADSGEDSMPLDAAADSEMDAASDSADDASGDVGEDTADDATADASVRPPFVPTSQLGELFTGHFLGGFEIHAHDTETLETLPGSPYRVGMPTGDLLALRDPNVVITTREGASEIVVLDASTLSPVAGSPYPTGNLSTALAHDPVTQLLYVYCIGTIGDPSRSEVSVFDTSSIPFARVPGSPFAIDVAANDIRVDPNSGVLVGRSLSGFFMVRLQDGAFEHLGGSPIEVEGTGTGLAVDPVRERAYFATRRPGTLHAYDMNTFAPVAGSPVALSDASSIGDIAINTTTGDVFIVDFGARALTRVTAELTEAPPCAGTRCTIPSTETGLALDEEKERLFFPLIPDPLNPDSAPGFLTAWDISDPNDVTEITGPGERPRLSLFPNRMSIR